MRISYVVATRDETTERDVDLMRVMTIGGRWYLEAWCHRAEDVRLFRVDRVAAATILDVDGTPPAEAVSRSVDGAEDTLFTPSENDLVVTLEVEPRGRWVAEYYPVEETEELPGGRLRITLKVANPRWLPRLVLRLGGAGRIVSPLALADEATDAARAALAQY
jgi:predicted DNA-binding transcriptional regulator YafY